MLSHKYKCIFIHIPKTAGQSIEHVFLDLHGLDWDTRASLLLKKNSDPKLGPQRLAHLTASEYVDKSHISKELFNSYFKFSFVRNPWSRFLSEYKWKQKAVDSISDKLSKQDDGFNDKQRHLKSQYDFLFDSDGNQLVDFIGRFENLHEDFNTVCDKIGIERQLLPHVNNRFDGKQKHPDYTDYYDDESRYIIEDKYAKDIKYFDYKFGK